MLDPISYTGMSWNVAKKQKSKNNEKYLENSKICINFAVAKEARPRNGEVGEWLKPPVC